MTGMTRADEHDALLREIHGCPQGLTCRPGRGVRYPLPAQGHLGGDGVDVLLVGWNPRTNQCEHLALPPLDALRSEARHALDKLHRSDAPEAQRLRSVLPPTHRLDDARVMRTYLWKWPTRIKTSIGDSAFYAKRCMTNHFEKELAILQPRLLLTFHTEAAHEMAERARALGVEVREPHPLVRRGEALGWTLPHDAWGWSMGLVLLKDAADAYDANTRTWAQKAAAHVLDHARG